MYYKKDKCLKKEIQNFVLLCYVLNRRNSCLMDWIMFTLSRLHD